MTPEEAEKAEKAEKEYHQRLKALQVVCANIKPAIKETYVDLGKMRQKLVAAFDTLEKLETLLGGKGKGEGEP